jgi:methionine synthase I (cobalamin-dependent)
MAGDFAKRLRTGEVIVFDGGMGTEIAARGGAPGAASNVECPEIVLAIQREYARAGANVITMNTFSVNRLALAKAGAAGRLREFAEAAGRIARKAAGQKCSVAGDIGATGEFVEPYGPIKPEEMRACFEEAARTLAENGAELFIVETLSEATEVTLAVQACKAAAPGLPVAATMSFDPVRGDFRTNTGLTAADAAKVLTDAGAEVIGANCGTVVPDRMAELVGRMRSASDRPILVQANAGLPELRGGRAVYTLTPEAFARGMAEAVRAGAQLAGGCCGTTPAHIRALRAALGK